MTISTSVSQSTFGEILSPPHALKKEYKYSFISFFSSEGNSISNPDYYINIPCLPLKSSFFMCTFWDFLSRFLSDSPCLFGFNSISASIVPSILRVSMLVKASYFPKRDFPCLFYQQRWSVLFGRGWESCSSVGSWIMKLWIRNVCIVLVEFRHRSS